MIVVVQAFKFIPPSQGGDRAVFAFCRELNELTDMTCISTTNNPTDQSPYQEDPLIEDIKMKYISPGVSEKIIAKSLELGAEVLVLNQPFMAPLLFRKAKKAGLKVAMYAHNLEYQRFKSMNKIWWSLLKRWEGWSMRLADFVLFISEDDMKMGKTVFQLPEEKLISVPFMISQSKSPDRNFSQKSLRSDLGISVDTRLLYFYGPMDYGPNREGLLLLLNEVVPRLKESGQKFMLILSGKNLDGTLKNLIDQYPSEVKWLGFVDDFEKHLQGVDIMLNPLWLGGGVKIKLMDALANGVTAVSFRSGAMGIDPTTAANKLHLIADQDAVAMVQKIIGLTTEDIQRPTPPSYYQRYSGKHVISQLLSKIQ